MDTPKHAAQVKKYGSFIFELKYKTKSISICQRAQLQNRISGFKFQLIDFSCELTNMQMLKMAYQCYVNITFLMLSENINQIQTSTAVAAVVAAIRTSQFIYCRSLWQTSCSVLL